MAYEKKFDGSTEVTYKLGAEGQPNKVEGYFLGTKIIPSQKKGYKHSILHVFNTDNGTVGVWGTTRLNRLLTKDLRGMMCLVEFTRMIPARQKGMKPAYGYEVHFDREKTIPVDHIDLTATLVSEEDNHDGPMDSDESDGDESFDEPFHSSSQKQRPPYGSMRRA